VADIGQVVAGLRQVVGQLPFATLADALEAAEEAHVLIEQAAVGSGQAEFQQVLDWFRRVVEGIGELQAELTAIQLDVTGVANRLEGAGRRNEPLASLAPAKPGAGSIETRAAEILSKLPVREGNNYKTAGIWIDEHGREREPMVSGRDEGYVEAKEMLRELRIGPARGDLLTAAHVEVKLVAHLRKTDAKAVTLIINNRPCQSDKWSCDTLLPRLLKPGQTVTIFWPGGSKTYRGEA